jgi:hypothetical protein
MKSRRSIALTGTVALALAAVVGCGGGDATDGATGGSVDGDATTLAADTSASEATAAAMAELAAGLPPECRTVPFTLIALGASDPPLGSEMFEAAGAVAVPVPVVPDKDQQLDPAEALRLAQETDLLGYTLYFGDEPIDAASTGVFDDRPLDGTLRGMVAIFPPTESPIVTGSVLEPGPIQFELFSSLSVVNFDIKSADGFTAYLEQPVGQVSILGLTDSALCVDVDLEWSTADGATARIDGVVTAELAPRSSLPFG